MMLHCFCTRLGQQVCKNEGEEKRRGRANKKVLTSQRESEDTGRRKQLGKRKDVKCSIFFCRLFGLGRPKGVPLTHRNLVASMQHVTETYSLSHSDTTLLVMPLFHVHGLIGAALSTLHSGVYVVCVWVVCVMALSLTHAFFSLLFVLDFPLCPCFCVFPFFSLHFSRTQVALW